MAGIITLAGAILQFLVKVIDIWREKDAEKKKLKQEALNVIKEGIATRDASKLTMGFDRMRRI